MATFKRFEELEIWQLARKMCIEIEKLIEVDLYYKNRRLKEQIQGSSGSVMDNIAEGFEKESTKEFINYLFYAKGSCGEMRSQLIRMTDLGYFSSEMTKPLITKGEEISRKIKRFIIYLQSIEHEGNRYAQEPTAKYGIEISENLNFEFFTEKN